MPIWHRSIDDVVDVVTELRKPGAVLSVLCDTGQRSPLHGHCLYAMALPSLAPRIMFDGVVLDVAENDEAAQRIARAADDFARQFLTRSARLRYWQAALGRYAALFKDYDASLDMTAIFA